MKCNNLSLLFQTCFQSCVCIWLVNHHVTEAAIFCSDKDIPDWPYTSPPELLSKAALKEDDEKDMPMKMDIDVSS